VSLHDVRRNGPGIALGRFANDENDRQVYFDANQASVRT